MVTFLLMALLGADFTVEEQKLLDGLGEPERAYVAYALTHGQDVTMTIPMIAAGNVEQGEAGELLTGDVSVQVLDKSSVVLTAIKTSSRALVAPTVRNLVVPSVTSEKAIGSIVLSGTESRRFSDTKDGFPFLKDCRFVVVKNRELHGENLRQISIVDMAKAEPVLQKLMDARGMRAVTLKGKAVRVILKSGNDPAVLREPDGTEHRILKARLTKEDRRWITEQLRRRRAAHAGRRE